MWSRGTQFYKNADALTSFHKEEEATISAVLMTNAAKPNLGQNQAACMLKKQEWLQ